MHVHLRLQQTAAARHQEEVEVQVVRWLLCCLTGHRRVVYEYRETEWSQFRQDTFQRCWCGWREQKLLLVEPAAKGSR